MGLETNSNVTLWKDEVNVEVNKAVLYSYEVSRASLHAQRTHVTL